MSKVNWSHLPVALPNGALIPHMSARLRRQYFDAAFEQLGGVPKLVAWAEESSDNYGKFLTIYGQGQSKAANIEHSLSDGIENLLERLDEQERAENAQIINGTATPVDTCTPAS